MADVSLIREIGRGVIEVRDPLRKPVSYVAKYNVGINRRQLKGVVPDGWTRIKN